MKILVFAKKIQFFDESFNVC